MHRSINLYLRGRGSIDESRKESEGTSNSVDSLVRASVSLRQSLQQTDCLDRKMVLHTQLDKLERQLLKQLGQNRLQSTLRPHLTSEAPSKVIIKKR